MYHFVVSLIIILSVLCTVYVLYKVITKQDKYNAPTIKESIILACTGLVSFISDSIGVGSFAINIAIGRAFKLVKDAEIPGFVNGVQVIPGAIEALFFLGALHVDPITLIVLISGATLGGFVGGIFASKVNTASTRLIMIIAFIIMIFLLIGKLMHILPIGGTLMKLAGLKLVVGFMGLFIAGFLVCFGVGLFAVVQAILFLLGMSPLVAFPIMTAAGAIQQPVTTMAFIFSNKVPLRKVMIVSVFGIIGVFIGCQLVTMLSTEQLQWLLVIVITYNTVSLVRVYRKSREIKTETA